VKAKRRESKINLGGFQQLGALGSLGLGVVGGGARAPGIGATVMKEAVNICLGVYLGMLALQSGFEASRVRMNMSA
jgi:hypothetical protein